MVKWFHSKSTEYISLIVNEDAAQDCQVDLGKMGVLQFTDLNPDQPPPFQRRFVSYVKRCDELELKILFFSNECDRFDLDLDSVSNVDEIFNAKSNQTGQQLLEGLEVELEGYKSQLGELNSFSEKLTAEYNEKVELQEVLEKVRRFFMNSNDRTESLLGANRKDTIERLILRSLTTEIVSSKPVVKNTLKTVNVVVNNIYAANLQNAKELVDSSTVLLENETSLKIIGKSFCSKDTFATDCKNEKELVDSRSVFLKKQGTWSNLLGQLNLISLREKKHNQSLNLHRTDVSGIAHGEGFLLKECFQEIGEVVKNVHSITDVMMPFSGVRTYSHQESTKTKDVFYHIEANDSFIAVCSFFAAVTIIFFVQVISGEKGHGLI